MVELVTVIKSSLDASQFESGITRVEAAARRGGLTIEQVNQRSGRSWVEASGAAERYVKQIAAQYSAVQRYTQVFDTLTKAVDAGRISADLAESTLEAWAAKLGLVTVNARAAAAVMVELQARTMAAADANQVASRAQAAYNASTSAGVYGQARTTTAPLIGANPLYGVARDERETSLTSAFADADKERAGIDKVFAASKQYESQVKALNNQLAIGNISQIQYDHLLEQGANGYARSVGVVNALETAHAGLNESVKGSAASFAQQQFAARQAQVQTIQFLSSIASGQPIWMAALQQGHQMLDVASATGTGFGALGLAAQKAWAAVSSGPGLVIAGIAAVTGAVVALSVSAENTSRRIEGLKNAIALVNPANVIALSEQAERVARTVVRTSPIGTDITQARAGTAALATAPGFAGTDQQRAAVIQQFAEYSKMAGEAELNTERLTKALKAPSDVMDELASRNIPGFTAALANSAREMETRGKAAETWNILLTRMAAATSQATNNLTPLEKAVIGLNNALSIGSAAGKGIAQTLGEDINNKLALVVTGFTEFIRLLNSIPKDWATGIVNSLLQAVPVLGQINSVLTAIQALKNIGGPASQPGLPGTGAPGTPGGSTAQSYDINVATAVVAGLVAKGVPQLDAIALSAMNIAEAGGKFNGPVGDLKIQPGYDPTFGNYPGGSHGGFQWNKGRLANFMNQNQGQLPEQTSMDAQLAFVVNELATTHKAVADAARGTNDLAQKTAIYTGRYEVPADVQRQIPGRVATALDIQSRLGSGSSGSGSGEFPNVPATAPGPTTSTFGSLSTSAQATVEKMEALRKQYDATATSATTFGGELVMSMKFLDEYGDKLKPEELEAYKRAQLDLAAAIDNNRTAQEQNQHAMDLSADLSQQLTEGDRRRAGVLQQLNEIEKQHPGTQGLEDQARALATFTREQEGQLRQAEYGLDRQIIGNKELAAATLQGGAAVQRATAATQAFAEASKLFASGSPEQHAAFVRLSDDYLKVAQSAAVLQVQQQIKLNNDQVEMLQQESAALGINDQARVAMLANLKAEQYLKTQGIPLESAYGQAYLASAAAVTQLGYTLQQNKAGVDAFASAFSQSFDTIGNAMAQSFLQGSGAAVNWKNVMTTVIQQVIQQMLKLSVLNPIMNKLFGQNNPTIESGLNGLASGNGPLSGLARALGGISSVSSASFDPSALGAVFSSSAGEVAATAGGAGASALESLGFFTPLVHSGGLIGTDTLSTRLVHPAYFDDAPRLHAGLANDEIAAILQKGERVLTVAQTERFDRLVAQMTKIMAAVHHSGGMVGRGIETREVSPSIFATAPRFHDGYQGDDVAATLNQWSGSLAQRPGMTGGPPSNQPAGEVNFHAHFNFGSAPANIDTFRRSAPQIARGIGKQVRSEMSRGRS